MARGDLDRRLSIRKKSKKQVAEARASATCFLLFLY